VKKALVVAINDYGGAPNDLPSCLEDADQFTALLSSRGFKAIQKLTDEDATAANLEAELEALFADANDDDRLVFYFSGHGYTKLVDGVMEEMLVLRGVPPFFPDDKLVSLTRALPPGTFTAVIDACFGGGAFKAIVDPFSFESIVEVAQVKYWTPPPDVSEQAISFDGKGTKVRKFKPFCQKSLSSRNKLASALKRYQSNAASVNKASSDPTEAFQPELQGLLFAACQENETAAASTSKTNGMSAFTHSLLTTINRVGASPSTRQLLAEVSTHLESLGFEQTPLVLEPSIPGDLQLRTFLELQNVLTATTVPASLNQTQLMQAVLYAVLPVVLRMAHDRLESEKRINHSEEKMLEIALPWLLRIFSKAT
jgi:hypothetical protein